MVKILSICIPVYNRAEIFEQSLFQTAICCEEHFESVEIVISDNASEEDLSGIVKYVKGNFPKVSIRYSRNETNLGMGKNFLQVIDMAEGEYCWLIGSDDFIKKNALVEILNLIKSNDDVDFINVGFDLFLFDKLPKNNTSSRDFSKLLEYLDEEENLLKYTIIDDSNLKKFSNLEGLINERYNNVFLGSIMANIFKKRNWENVVYSENINTENFCSLESIYPHCYIYSKAYMNSTCIRYPKECITVGEGAREWSTDGDKLFWQTSLPLIYFKILGDIVSQYRKEGLGRKAFNRAKGWTGEIAGTYVVQYIKTRYLLRQHVKNEELISLYLIIKRYWNVKRFYKGIKLSLRKEKRVIK